MTGANKAAVSSDIAPDAKAQTNQQNEKVDKSFLGGLPNWMHLAIKICLGLWFANFLVGIVPIKDRGTFGDTFGAANSLFSALALLGVAWSVSMQREELRLTRKDRNDTKKSLKKAQKHLKKQEKNIAKQNVATERQMFEATFFQMFSAFSDVTREIEISYTPDPPNPLDVPDDIYLKYKDLEEYNNSLVADAKGREAFEVLVNELQKKFDIHLKHREKEDPQGHEDAMVEEYGFMTTSEERYNLVFKRAYDSLYQQYGDDLGRYFRTLFTIMNFVQTAKIKDEDRKPYIKFLRAQLSMHEATMLMLNYLSPYTTEKFNQLCSAYGMGKNADWNNHVLQTMRYRLPQELRGRRPEA